ncbi:hypothetical protein EP1X_01630 [Thermococcus sp. EP1]|uniref:hypothetical protein n=1 Tax=Thermococcus sp. EP1 TaxID=1591054 RepID=UPI0006DA81AB|nr:hypothetical protein [Thermococcus sp. EP1]KPU63915.1 hypothetical protein EP1X_01630 [Thermococcus sp. EP1]
MNNDLKNWLPLLIVFKLAFRLLIFLDLELAPVFFLNIPLFLKMFDGFLLFYLVGMLAVEVYLILILRKGDFPLNLLLMYFITAVFFDLPYVLFRGLVHGNFNSIFFLVLPWYISTLTGLGITLRLTITSQ